MLSFVYVKDLASTTVEALFSQAKGTYNITDGNCYNRYEMANITKELLTRKTLKFHLPYNVVKALALILERSYALLKKTPALNIEKLNELTAVNWCCDIEKAKNELQFQPRYNLQQGLKESLEWYRVNKWL
jgi:nucleoside-diphosphate-sugar epimerase